MTRNKIEDLRNHLFALLEGLSDENLTAEERMAAIEKAQAGAMLGKVIVDSVKTEIMFEVKKSQYYSRTGENLATPNILQISNKD